MEKILSKLVIFDKAFFYNIRLIVWIYLFSILSETHKFFYYEYNQKIIVFSGYLYKETDI